MAGNFPQAALTAWGTYTKPVCNCGDARANVKSRLIRSPLRQPAADLWAAAYCWCASNTHCCISAAFVYAGLFARNSQFHQFALQSGVISDLPLQAAGYVDRCGSDEVGELTAQKQHHADNIFGLAETTERHDLGCHCQELLPRDCRAHLPIMPVPLTGID